MQRRSPGRKLWRRFWHTREVWREDEMEIQLQSDCGLKAVEEAREVTSVRIRPWRPPWVGGGGRVASDGGGPLLERDVLRW